MTKDDKEFKAHRNVLSPASPFFHKHLHSDMKKNREVYSVKYAHKKNSCVMKITGAICINGKLNGTDG